MAAKSSNTVSSNDAWTKVTSLRSEAVPGIQGIDATISNLGAVMTCGGWIP